MLLSSCVVWRHRELERLPPRVPRRRRGAAAARLGAARRRARVARRARRAGRVAGDREPAHGRQAVRPARPRRRRSRARCRTVALRLPTASVDRRADDPRTGGFAASPELVARYIAPAAPLRLRGEPVVDGRRARARARARRRADAPGWTSSTAATCPTRRGTRREFVAGSPSCTRGWRGSSTRTASSSSTRAACRGRRRTSSRRPPAGAARVRTTCWTSGARGARARADGRRARRRGAGRGASSRSGSCRSRRRREPWRPCA